MVRTSIRVRTRSGAPSSTRRAITRRSTSSKGRSEGQAKRSRPARWSGGAFCFLEDRGRSLVQLSRRTPSESLAVDLDFFAHRGQRGLQDRQVSQSVRRNRAFLRRERFDSLQTRGLKVDAKRMNRVGLGHCWPPLLWQFPIKEATD